MDKFFFELGRRQATVTVIHPFDRDNDTHSFAGFIQAMNDIGIRVHDEDTTILIPWSNIQSVYWEDK